MVATLPRTTWRWRIPNHLVATGPKTAGTDKRVSNGPAPVLGRTYLHRTGPCDRYGQSRALRDLGGQQLAVLGHRRCRKEPGTHDKRPKSRERQWRHTALVMLAVRMGLLANLDWYLVHFLSLDSKFVARGTYQRNMIVMSWMGQKHRYYTG